MNKTILKCELHSKGERREEHPTGFKNIHIEVVIGSPDATEADLQKVIAMAEEKYCPVWSMIKGNTTVTTSCVIIR